MQDFSTETNNNTPPAPPAEGGSKAHIPWPLLLIIAAAAIVGAAYYFWWAPGGDQTFPDPHVDLSGVVNITAGRLDERSAAQLYNLNISTGELSRAYSDDSVEYTGVVSPQGDKIAYFESPLDLNAEFTYPYSEPLQLVVRELQSNTKSISETYPLIAQRMPVWSPDGTKIAYTGLVEGGSFNNANDWRVVVHDLSEDTTEGDSVYVGTYPLWSPDGSQLLALRNDGIHLLDVPGEDTSNFVATVRSHGFGVAVNINLSEDKTLLAISEPEERQADVYTITTWDPFTLEQKATFRYGINRLLFWPIISPDNKFIAFRISDWDPETETKGVPGVIVFDFETLTPKELTLSLDPYDPNLFFLTDWR